MTFQNDKGEKFVRSSLPYNEPDEDGSVSCPACKQHNALVYTRYVAGVVERGCRNRSCNRSFMPKSYKHSANEIGRTNAACAWDQRDSGDHKSKAATLSAYRVNTVDTCREYGVSADEGMRAFDKELARLARATYRGRNKKA